MRWKLSIKAMRWCRSIPATYARTRETMGDRAPSDSSPPPPEEEEVVVVEEAEAEVAGAAEPEVEEAVDTPFASDVAEFHSSPANARFCRCGEARAPGPRPLRANRKHRLTCAWNEMCDGKHTCRLQIGHGNSDHTPPAMVGAGPCGCGGGWEAAAELTVRRDEW
jgi:hypothetical protein